MTKSIRQSTLQTLGLGTVADIFRTARLPAEAGELVDRVFGGPNQRGIVAAHPDALQELSFASGSMGPKVEAACRFVRETGRRSAIGRLRELRDVVEGRAGTQISNAIDGIVYAEAEAG